MFLVTSITTLRERRTGTLERLLSMPLGKGDFILGYTLAFGAARRRPDRRRRRLRRVGVRARDRGQRSGCCSPSPLADAILGTALGLLASAFARTEFQVVQFMPVLIFPQILLGGIFIPRDQLPDGLEAISDWLPLSTRSTPSTPWRPTRGRGLRRGPAADHRRLRRGRDHRRLLTLRRRTPSARDRRRSRDGRGPGRSAPEALQPGPRPYGDGPRAAPATDAPVSRPVGTSVAPGQGPQSAFVGGAEKPPGVAAGAAGAARAPPAVAGSSQARAVRGRLRVGQRPRWHRRRHARPQRSSRSCGEARLSSACHAEISSVVIFSELAEGETEARTDVRGRSSQRGAATVASRMRGPAGGIRGLACTRRSADAAAPAGLGRGSDGEVERSTGEGDRPPAADAGGMADLVPR